MITRRQFMKVGAAAGAAAVVPWNLGVRRAFAAKSPQLPLAASVIQQFVDPLPNLLDADHLIVDDGDPDRAGNAGAQDDGLAGGRRARLHRDLRLVVSEGRVRTVAQLLPRPCGCGHAGSAHRDEVRQPAGEHRRHQSAGLQVLHRPDAALGRPERGHVQQWNPWRRPSSSPAAQNYDGPIPACVHLHGGEVPPELDGGPDAWFTSDGSDQGARLTTARTAPRHRTIASTGTPTPRKAPSSGSTTTPWAPPA